ncbi:MAG: hypothetical protein NDP13_00015 [Crenarchaeota archaeon]|nr:hypothetical protein [Thermoproteota archaeon]MCR8453378.1 hypothetical protein [Thermoproteota archaeon]MCR8455718.1 hypothetical protein [Thermoproteota archaeon]MCR8462555.1 hypothetical protein [Thermoproteota archaeon]MCR8470717.1 hypothetical protein [Thermoproteota archaeon]
MEERSGPGIPAKAKARVVCPHCGQVWGLSGDQALPSALALVNRIACPNCNKTILVKARARTRKHILAV